MLTRVLTAGLHGLGRRWNPGVPGKAAKQVNGQVWTGVDLARETRDEGLRRSIELLGMNARM
ncbi:hypothetical protein GCM10010191_93760 [Actinomadura vinacea]|uniref:Uncharacterized protein n=1 Tax=Actinomadura vinacea TaxID=115336 RepID=A0ABP5XSK5_9ACTN